MAEASAVIEGGTLKTEPAISPTKTIVLAGKPGSGKSTILEAVFGVKKQQSVEPSGISNPPGTREVKRYEIALGDITFTIVDTVGLSQKKSVRRKLEKELSSEQADLLLLCISVAPGQRFEEDMPPIIKSLHKCYGTDIWRHCLPVLTFSNLAWDVYGQNPDLYKKRTKVYCDLLQLELRKLVPEVEVIIKTIFESPDPHSREGWPTIVAVPAGQKPGDQVLPGFEMDWTVILKKEIRCSNTYRSQVDSPLASKRNSTTSDSINSSDNTNSSVKELAEKLPDNEDKFIQQVEDRNSKNETISRKHMLIDSTVDRLLGRPCKKPCSTPCEKLHVSPQSLPSCTITIAVSLYGQYQFPSDTHLVSPVLWLHCDPPCKFSKQLTVEIPHCAPRENSSRLRIVVCTDQKALPFSFKVISGSTFSENTAYGLVSLSQLDFSGIAVVQESLDERCYWSSVFYMGPPKNRDIHFAVTWNDDAHITTMNEKYEQKKAIPGPQQSISFKESSISLEIPKDGLVLGDQWEIYPAIPPKIPKKEVDDHQTRNMRATVPHCELVARWMKGDQQMQPLKHRVDILGATEEKYFRINIHEDLAAEIPCITVTISPPTHVEVKRLLKSLTPEQTRSLGVELGLHYPNLKKKSDECLLDEMINSWLMKEDNVHETSGPPSWGSLVKALEEIGCTGVAEKIRKTSYRE